MSKNKKRSPFVALLLLALILIVAIVFLTFLVFFVEGCNGKLKRNAYKLQAEPIIEALEEYHRKIGRYPNSFDVLVPKYSKEKLPSGWRYENHRSYIGYYLYTPNPGFGNSEYCYSSLTKSWHLDDDFHKWVEGDLWFEDS